VLAVPHDANADVIRAAYDRAKSKYDLGQVEGLGDEIKQHYVLKAQEVDRAFEMLVDSSGFSSASQPHELPADHLTGVSNS
jgi:preprotein translocase subunit Sec63